VHDVGSEKQLLGIDFTDGCGGCRLPRDRRHWRNGYLRLLGSRHDLQKAIIEALRPVFRLWFFYYVDKQILY
jgi:hypothetical protein